MTSLVNDYDITMKSYKHHIILTSFWDHYDKTKDKKQNKQKKQQI